MNPKADQGRRQLRQEIRDSLRELTSQVSLLNHRVGAKVELKDVDLDCLDIIGRHGPMTPSGLARHAGLHPATITGILDRLERNGWIARDRDPSDRRAVVVRALRDRGGELLTLYAGMNSSIDQILSTYDDKQLEVVADFLQRAAEAGSQANDVLADGERDRQG